MTKEYDAERRTARAVAGICANCDQFSEEGKTRCKKHIERAAEYREGRRSTEGCTDCDQPASAGKRRCKEHAARRAASRAARSAKRSAAGLCVECDQPAAGKSLCKEHAERQAKRLIERKDAGLCRNCDLPRLYTNIFCEEHYFRRAARTYLGHAKRWTELRDLWIKQIGKCAYLGTPLKLGTNTALDHIHPRSKGGTNDLDNLCWTSWFFNNLKSDYTLDELRAVLLEHPPMNFILTLDALPLESK